MTKNIPAWLASQLLERGAKEVTVRSETVAELHARILEEKGERWDNATQSWVKA